MLITRPSLTNLRLPYIKTEFCRFKLFYSGASLFNLLPNDLKIIANDAISWYKIKLKKFFLQLHHDVHQVVSSRVQYLFAYAIATSS